jgi:hypothetical protein
MGLRRGRWRVGLWDFCVRRMFVGFVISFLESEGIQGTIAGSSKAAALVAL